jgi:hypothetical protein
MEIRDVALNERTGEVTVTALVDNMKLVRSSTWDEPEEYAPGLCISSFFLEDVDFTLEDTDALENYLYTINWDLLLDDDI